ncbi:MAG TPA: glycine/sarcosine/betaine reductase selenoprotein B family protein [Syntrophorhabdales bacterium]|nr:glycine/sarcosine/betaine reductase selenoprotein B family protein [Syntrophorhabdales bacterium]
MEHFQTHRSFVSYIDRTREFYAAQGYPKAYAWPRYDDVPFVPLPKPLSLCRVGLVTTAGKPQVDMKLDSLGFGLSLRELYAQPVAPPPTRLYTQDLGWDKEATHTEDVDSFLPINRLLEYAAEGRIGSVSPRFYGVPTDYSQKRTSRRYAPQVMEWCQEDSVDAVLLPAL